MKILVFEMFEKGQILRPFSGLAPSKLKFKQKKLRVNYVCIEELFKTTFDININNSWGGLPPSLPERMLR